MAALPVKLAVVNTLIASVGLSSGPWGFCPELLQPRAKQGVLPLRDPTVFPGWCGMVSIHSECLVDWFGPDKSQLLCPSFLST